MPAHRKASIRQLTSAAYELDSGVVEGELRHDSENDRWMIGDQALEDWVAQYDGQEIVVIVSSLDDPRPVPPKLCRTCGSEYVGIECPRCREARIRLRGR